MTGLAYALAKLGQADGAMTWLQKSRTIRKTSARAIRLDCCKPQATPTPRRQLMKRRLPSSRTFLPVNENSALRSCSRRTTQPQFHTCGKRSTSDSTIRICRTFSASATAAPIAWKQRSRATAPPSKADPNLAEAHLNLAFALQRLRRAAEEYETACKLDEKFCPFAPTQ